MDHPNNHVDTGHRPKVPTTYIHTDNYIAVLNTYIKSNIIKAVTIREGDTITLYQITRAAHASRKSTDPQIKLDELSQSEMYPIASRQLH